MADFGDAVHWHRRGGRRGVYAGRARTGRCWGCTGRGCGVCAAGRGGIVGKRILIIDDDVSIGNLVEEVLNGAGYDTLRAYSGTEAFCCSRPSALT